MIGNAENAVKPPPKWTGKFTRIGKVRLVQSTARSMSWGKGRRKDKEGRNARLNNFYQVKVSGFSFEFYFRKIERKFFSLVL